jgi:hypothetical protein
MRHCHDISLMPPIFSLIFCRLMPAIIAATPFHAMTPLSAFEFRHY